MALRRFLSRLVAAASARRRTDPSPPRRLTMAAARARVDKAGDCAVARAYRVRTCADECVRDLRAHGAARAQAARAFYITAHTRAAAAAAFAGPKLLQASDRAIYNILRVLYGQSPPVMKTPSRLDILNILDILRERAEMVNKLLDKCKMVLDIFVQLPPNVQSLILTLLGCPFVAIGLILAYLTPSTLSSAPECFCPFLGISPCEDFAVHDGLNAVASLVGTCGGRVLRTTGGICICACIDIAEGLKGLIQMMIGNDLVETRKTFNIMNDFTPEVEGKMNQLIPAKYLYMKVLLDLFIQTVKGKTPEEIRKTFNVMENVAGLKTTCDEDFSKVIEATLFDLTLIAEGLKGLLQMMIDKDLVETRKTFNIMNDFTPEVEGKMNLLIPAKYLDMKVPLDLISQTVKGKTPEEIRKTFSVMASVAELKTTFDKDFFKVNQATLFYLILAANLLDIKGSWS